MALPPTSPVTWVRQVASLIPPPAPPHDVSPGNLDRELGSGEGRGGNSSRTGSAFYCSSLTMIIIHKLQLLVLWILLLIKT